MNDIDDLARGAAERLREHGELIGVEPTSAHSTPATRSRTPAIVIVVAALLVTGVVGVAALARRTTGVVSTVDTSIAPSTEAAPPTNDIATSTESPGTTDQVTVPSSPGPAAALERPIVDDVRCVPGLARETVVESLTLFTRPSEAPIAVQLFGAESGDPSSPLVIVERFFADQRPGGAGETFEVGGRIATVLVDGEGRGVVGWILDDGSEIYMRSLALDEAQLVAVARSVVPRDTTAVVPGVELDMGLIGSDTVQLDETFADISGTAKISSCELAGPGGTVWVAVLTGDLLFRYAGVLDNGSLRDARVVGETIVLVNGPVHTPPFLAEGNVRDASPAEWAALLAADEG